MATRVMLSSPGGGAGGAAPCCSPPASSQLELCWWEGGREGKLKLGWGQGGQCWQGSTMQLKSWDSQSFITGKMRAILEGFNKNIVISTSRETLLVSFMEDSYLTPGFIYRNGILAGFLFCFSFALFQFFIPSFLSEQCTAFWSFCSDKTVWVEWDPSHTMPEEQEITGSSEKPPKKWGKEHF